MAGVLGALLQAERGIQVKPSGKDDFSKRFVADSASAGAHRHLSEVKGRAERLFMQEDWTGAMAAFEEMANAAQELEDRPSEAMAVLGLAECLSKPAEIDFELVSGMYRYAKSVAKEVGDGTLEFTAASSHARLLSTVEGSTKASVAAWEEALSIARAQEQTEQIAYSLTQLGLVLLRDQETSKVEVVNENKETEGHLGVSGSADAGKVSVRNKDKDASDAVRAVKILVEADRLMEAAGPAQRATARMNVSQARLAHGTSLQKRAAERDIATAMGLWEEAGSQEAAQRSATVLLELYEENMWLVDSEEAKARMEKCRSQISGVKVHDLVGAKPSVEEKTMMERAVWARQKLAQAEAAAADGSDSDEGPSLIKPKDSSWAIDSRQKLTQAEAAAADSSDSDEEPGLVRPKDPSWER